MARELDAQFKARGLLMASLSHDLKTPLTRIRMRLESLPEGTLVERSIADIHEADALLDLALGVFARARTTSRSRPSTSPRCCSRLSTTASSRDSRSRSPTTSTRFRGRRRSRRALLGLCSDDERRPDGIFAEHRRSSAMPRRPRRTTRSQVGTHRHGTAARNASPPYPPRRCLTRLQA
jgi:hypothetical protein